MDLHTYSPSTVQVPKEATLYSSDTNYNDRTCVTNNTPRIATYKFLWYVISVKVF